MYLSSDEMVMWHLEGAWLCEEQAYRDGEMALEQRIRFLPAGDLGIPDALSEAWEAFEDAVSTYLDHTEGENESLRLQMKGRDGHEQPWVGFSYVFHTLERAGVGVWEDDVWGWTREQCDALRADPEVSAAFRHAEEALREACFAEHPLPDRVREALDGRADDGLSSCPSVGVCDTYDTEQRAMLFSFGAYGDTHVLVWERSVEDGLETAAEWLLENEPGAFCDDAVHDAYARAMAVACVVVASGHEVDWDDAQEAAREAAETDVTCTDSGCLPSHEWFVRDVEDLEAWLKEVGVE